ncbi:IS1182 family transposase [Nonomuraea sp. NPDC051941]|uniref:IS1182 family transposase n=1 Tax=Nonomuraea sp. NPDC051941 TaxID=3364373 RepID=UPI0037C992F6
MLEQQGRREVPELTARVVAAAFPKGTLAVWLRDALGEVFSDELFAEAFPADGRPAISPGALAAVSVLQYADNLSDRRAAEAVRARMDWKYLLGLELTDPGFDHSVLSDFRARLAEHGLEEKIFEAVLEVAAARGLLRPGGRQRTDSTKILADVRLLNRMEFVGEVLRTALEALAVAHPSWLEEALAGQEERWLRRYGERIDAWHGDLPGADREQWLRQVGQDGFLLLEEIDDARAPAWLRLIPALAALRRCWDEQYLRDEHGVRPREGAQLPPGAQRTASPHDAQARYGAKRGQGWVGYTLHVTETCEAEAPRLITDVATGTAADGDDSAALPGIHQRLERRGLLPAEHLLDSGYITAAALVEAAEVRGVVLIGPARPITAAAADGRFTHEDFLIDDQARTALCPGGHTSISWAPTHSAKGVPIIQVRFAAAGCRACPLRQRCTTADNPQWGRALTLRHPRQRAALQQRRREQDTPAWRHRYRPRAGIESTVHQLTSRTGLRRSRYRGLQRTHLGHCLAAAAINLIRIHAWEHGIPPEPTRRTHLSRLLHRCAR